MNIIHQAPEKEIGWDILRVFHTFKEHRGLLPLAVYIFFFFKLRTAEYFPLEYKWMSKLQRCLELRLT